MPLRISPHAVLSWGRNFCVGEGALGVHLDERITSMLDGTTVTLTFEGRLPDGSVYDKMTAENPLVFQVGHDMVLDGFEREVREMAEGEKKIFTIKDWEAFGEHLDEHTEEIPMELMPNMKGLEIGKVIWIITEDEEKVPVTISNITPEAVTIDYNHPLAGNDLTFDVEIIKVDESTADDPNAPKREIPKDPLDLIM